ncbi:MAG TPA: hypothetical protein PLI95_10070 [Polyangiaceae bacterium]|nr:hypothetical protein [Polyangiaceae bacterium]
MEKMRRIVAAGLGVVLLAGLLGAASGLIGPAGDPFDPTLLRSRPLQSGDSAGDTSLSITVERSGFPLIRVYADVLDESDGPVAGLAGPDFAVTQDGAPVSFSLLPAAEIGCPAAFCLVFDVSLSMAGEPLECDDDVYGFGRVLEQVMQAAHGALDPGLEAVMHACLGPRGRRPRDGAALVRELT